MKDYFNYVGKTCVVTGGSNGMGKATVEMLLDLGAKVYNLDLVPGDIAGMEYIQVNLTERESIDKAFEKLPPTIDKFFGVAGIVGVGPGQTAELVVKINFLSYKYMLDNYLFDRMAWGGAIAFITSGACRGWITQKHEYFPMIHASYDWALEFIRANEHMDPVGSYAISKRALACIIAAKSEKYYEKEIRINNVMPGHTKTGLLEGVVKFMGSDDFMHNYFGVIKRESLPEEIASLLVFVNSDLASFVTAATISGEGGLMTLCDLGVRTDINGGAFFKGPVLFPK